MPGTQPRGIHSFNLGSSSSVLATQVLDKVNAEDDEEEDQAGPPVDTPAAFTSTMSSLFPHDPSTASFMGTLQSDVLPPPSSSSISPTTHPNHVSHSQQHVSVDSTLFCTTSSETSSSQQKRKHDATGSMLPPSSK